MRAHKLAACGYGHGNRCRPSRLLQHALSIAQAKQKTQELTESGTLSSLRDHAYKRVLNVVNGAKGEKLDEAFAERPPSEHPTVIFSES